MTVPLTARHARLALALMVVVVGTALLAITGAEAQERLAAIPSKLGHVTDAAGLLSEPQREDLEGVLVELRTRTGVHFAVLTVPGCAPEEPAAYKKRVFESWQLGGGSRDDGLLLLVTMEERRIEFATGYGLEGDVPDGWQSRMIRDLAAPRFRAGQAGEGIAAAVRATAGRIAGVRGVKLRLAGPASEAGGRPATPGVMRWVMPSAGLLIAILAVVGLMLALRWRQVAQVPQLEPRHSPTEVTRNEPEGTSGRQASAITKEDPMATYKMVQIPPNVAVSARTLLGKAPNPSEVAAEYLESIVNQHAKEGWEFMRIDTIGVSTQPGCLAGLLGAKSSDANYYVVTFRR